jgi:Holliday junction DNA helicase RuvA
VSAQTSAKLPSIGEETFLYTHMNLSQESVSLCGFGSREELSCFKMLISVSGIGARTAMEVLSALSHEQVAMAVASGDYRMLTAAKGIGPKQAQRIVLELKDKVKSLGAPPEIGITAGNSAVTPPVSKIGEVVGALMVLGCSAAEASKLAAMVDQSQTVEQMIASSLRLMNRK